MQRSFTIKPSQGTAGRGHNHFPQRGYPKTHPYVYQAHDSQGWVVFILSKRDDYAGGQRLQIDSTQISSSHYYLDNSPPVHLTPSARRQQHQQQPQEKGDVNSDVIVMVSAITPKNGLLEVSGEIFYFDPKLKDLPAGTLRDTFKDKAKITVLTHVKQYNFHAGQTFIFEKLRDVTASGGTITATDGLMPVRPSGP